MLSLEDLMQAKLAGVGNWLTNTLVDCSELKHRKGLKVALVIPGTSCSWSKTCSFTFMHVQFMILLVNVTVSVHQSFHTIK